MDTITLGNLAEVVAVISIIGHFYQHFKHKTEEKIMLGFLHGLKPLVEGAAADHPPHAHIWAGEVKQIDNMLARLQPPQKKNLRRCVSQWRAPCCTNGKICHIT